MNINEKSDTLHSEGDTNLSLERASWRQQIDDPGTLDWLERDEKLFLHQSLSTPCLDVLVGAKGSEVTNIRGGRYIDFHGNSVHQIGYQHPKILEAIRNQLDTLPFCPRRFTNVPAIELAQKLIDLTPSDLGRVLFAPGGTSAIGMALKIARMVTSRFKTISMWDSFHGASLDAISIGGEADFRKNAGPLLPGTEHVPPPNPATCPFKCNGSCNLQCADYVDYVLGKEGDVAAVVSETVSSVPYFPPVEYWHRVREACDKHNALLILDEIPHSLGRTGTLFAFEHYEITPDLLVLGKGLGGGVFPLAAVIAKEEFNVVQDRSIGHYTHEKNPVACAAGLATLEIIVEENLAERSNILGREVRRHLQANLHKFNCVSDIRGLGLLLGIELDDEQYDGKKLASEVLYACLQSGLSFKVSMGTVLTLAPPLNISQKDLDRALDILIKAIGVISARAQNS